MTHNNPSTPAMDALVRPDDAPAPFRPDRVITIAIGDQRADGTIIPPAAFRLAALIIADDVRRAGGDVYAVTFGDGITSDQESAQVPERSAIVLGGNVRDVIALRALIAQRLASWQMSSAACAIDAIHRPVWAADPA